MLENLSSGIGKIAFIGVGGMGAGMARNLLRAGYEVTVCSRTMARAEPLLAAGARLAQTPRLAVSGAKLIFSMVGDDDDSRSVWLGPDGVLAGMPGRGAIGVECSTLSLAWVRQLSQAVSQAGLRYLDCPVTGGRAGAAAGTLTLLVGGEADAVRDAAPALHVIGQEQIHFGPVGSATAYKLVVNMMVGAQAAALAEGLAVAQRAGLDQAAVLRALTSGAVASPVVKAYAPRMAAGQHGQPIQFVSRWARKDLAYAQQLAEAVGQPAPVLAAALSLLAQTADREPEANISAIFETVRQAAEGRTV